MSKLISNNKLIERMMKKCIQEVVETCAAMYSFSASDCIEALEVASSSSSSSSSLKPLKSKATKSFPLPFMREHVNEDGCNGIIFNHGLFTQCKNERTVETMCNTCSTENCGTLEARMSADFKDPKGRRPSSYIAVLRKLKLTQEQAIQEAGKVNIELNELHFVEQEKVKAVPKEKVIKEKVIKVKVVKEVVPKVKAVKVPKEKVVKEKVVKEVVPKVKAVKVQKEKIVKEKAGRPKSTKKAIETVTVEDLFASLVAEEVDFCSDEETELQTVTTVSMAAVNQANAAVEKAEAELAKAVAKEQKKSDAKAESKERNEMHSEEVEQKKVAAIEGKALAAAAAKELKEFAAAEKALATAADKELKALAAAEKALALAAEKEQKVAALLKDKEQKAAALAADKEQKAAALAAEKEQKVAALAEKAAALLKDKEQKAAALALDKEQKAAALAEAKQLKADALAEAKAAAKQLKADSAKPKTKTVVAAVAQTKPVEEQTTKVSVKRMTIEGVEYLISATNVLYLVSTREEAGIWNPMTKTIDELPEESDNEEVEDDYDSDTN